MNKAEAEKLESRRIQGCLLLRLVHYIRRGGFQEGDEGHWSYRANDIEKICIDAPWRLFVSAVVSCNCLLGCLNLRIVALAVFPFSCRLNTYIWNVFAKTLALPIEAHRAVSQILCGPSQNNILLLLRLRKHQCIYIGLCKAWMILADHATGICSSRFSFLQQNRTNNFFEGGWKRGGDGLLKTRCLEAQLCVKRADSFVKFVHLFILAQVVGLGLLLSFFFVLACNRQTNRPGGDIAIAYSSLELKKESLRSEDFKPLKCPHRFMDIVCTCQNKTLSTFHLSKPPQYSTSTNTNKPLLLMTLEFPKENCPYTSSNLTRFKWSQRKKWCLFYHIA